MSKTEAEKESKYIYLLPANLQIKDWTTTFTAIKIVFGFEEGKRHYIEFGSQLCSEYDVCQAFQWQCQTHCV